MRYIVDRIEGKFAVCEDEKRNMINVPLAELPKGIKESMEFCYSNDYYSIDEKEKQVRSNRIKDKMDRLWK